MMAFVYEAMDETRKQELLALAKPPTVLSFHHGYVIDRERDIIFLELGGQGSRPKEDGAPPNFYAFMWRGHPLYFCGYETWESKDGIRINHYFYDMAGFVCSKKLEPEIEAILAAITEAFEFSYAVGYADDEVQYAPKVSITFSPIHFI